MGTQRDVAGVVACMSEFVLLQQGYPALSLWCIVGLPRVCLTGQENTSLDSISNLHQDLEVGREGQGRPFLGKQFCET